MSSEASRIGYLKIEFRQRVRVTGLYFVREKNVNFMIYHESGCGLILESIASDFNRFQITFDGGTPETSTEPSRARCSSLALSPLGDVCDS